MKKSKLFKTISFSSLALLMGIAGTMAFAPLGTTTTPIANANEMTESTTTSGLGLDPKNDPIVYTTESGLEIRMSGSSSKYSSTTNLITNKNASLTQDLRNFYYFTMGTFSGTIYTIKSQTDKYTLTNEPVNWIILGLGPNTSYFLDEVASNLFSTWKTNTSGLSHNNTNGIAYGPYFFENVFESTTPAGSAINGVVPSKSYVMEKVKASIPVNPGNLNEIPEGCMLVISEKMLGHMYYNSAGALNAQFHNISSCNEMSGTDSFYGSRYRYYGNKNTNSTSNLQTWTISGNKGGDMYNYINSLFSKNTSGTIIENGLGFTQAQADLIIPQQLYSVYNPGNGAGHDTPETDGGTYYTMFPLAYRTNGAGKYQNFCIEDFLTSSAQRVTSFIGSNITYTYTLRTSASIFQTSAVYYNGDYVTFSIKYLTGARPAMVMKLQ